MNQLKVLIVDDEQSARDLLNNLIGNISWITIVGEAESVESAFPLVLKKRPDVILLDIQMPRENGFVLIKQMVVHRLETEVIFITAFEKYAIEAIKASAFDYLLKPVQKSELIGSLEKLVDKLKSVRTEDRFSSLLEQIDNHKKLKFRNRTGFVMIDPDEILYCQADSNYTIIELESGRNLVVSLNLGKVEEMLSRQSFCKISRSTIVHMKYISQVNRKNMTLELLNTGTHKLPISKKYLSHLENACENLFRIGK